MAVPSGRTPHAPSGHDLYVPVHPVRFVTAAALFDGHDAAINIMRRILQVQGAEVVHLGHDRSVVAVVDAVLEEDAQGVAISSYQGGHVEYFEYLAESLDRAGAGQVKIYGGQIVGVHTRDNDLIVNPNKAKQLNNIRTHAADEKLILTPPLSLTLEEALEFINDDELVEVTPKAIRLRKRVLDHNLRKASEKRSGAGVFADIENESAS